MSENEIFEKIKLIIKDQLGVEDEKIKMDATFIDDLSADSLDLVEFVMNLEEEFNISIPDSDAEEIVTIGDVVEYIKDRS